MSEILPRTSKHSKTTIRKVPKSNLRNGRGRRHGDCDAHHGCRQDHRLLGSVGELVAWTSDGRGGTGWTETTAVRAARHSAAACVTHRLAARSVPPFTATLILERSSAQPATFSLLLRGRFGGLQISRSEPPPGSADPSCDWSARTSVKWDVGFKWLSPLQKKEGGTSAFVNADLPQFWPLSASDFAFSSDVELIFPINRIILNPVNLK